MKNIQVKRLNYWSKNDIDFLINNYKTLSNEEIGVILNKTKYSVDAKSSRLKLKSRLV